MAQFLAVILALAPVQIGYHPNLGTLKILDKTRSRKNPIPRGMLTYHCLDPEGLVKESHLDKLVRITARGSGTRPWHAMTITAVELYEE